MSMKPNELKEYLKAMLVKCPERVTLITGKVGIGKSEIVKQTCDELGWEMIDIRLSLLSPVDLRGLPYTDKTEKRTHWATPTFLPPQDYDKEVVLFFDEFTTVGKEMQNACLQLLLNRQIGEYTLPEKARVICAGNLITHGAYVYKLSSALQDRFIEVELDNPFDIWKEYAYKCKIHPMVIAFHNYTNGSKLHTYKNDGDTRIFASPRSWFFVGLPEKGILNIGLKNGTVYEALKGTLGEGVATEMYGFLKVYRDLPNPKDILEKGKDIVPESSNIMYALVSALINEVRQKKEHLDRLITYSLKIPKEFSVVLVKDLLKTELKDSVVQCKAFDKWVDVNKSVVL